MLEEILIGEAFSRAIDAAIRHGRQFFGRNQAVESEVRLGALTALRNALTATEAYYFDEDSLSKKKQRERQRGVSGLWSRASAALVRFDQRASWLTYLKELGWAHPELWDTPRLARQPLDLETMHRFCDWLDQQIQRPESN